MRSDSGYGEEAANTWRLRPSVSFETRRRTWYRGHGAHDDADSSIRSNRQAPKAIQSSH